MPGQFAGSQAGESVRRGNGLRKRLVDFLDFSLEPADGSFGPCELFAQFAGFLPACRHRFLVRLCGFLVRRSEEHTSELQSLMSISYAVFCLKKKKKHKTEQTPRRRPPTHL